MSTQEIEVLIVGGGQSGLALSAHLGASGIPHLVVERHRIAERWRSNRWDSLVANGPAWHDRFPDMEFMGVDPDAFVPKEQIADYFVAFAEKISAPIRCGVEVTSVTRNVGRPGFRVETSDGPLDAKFVVAATGPFQEPVIPPLIPTEAVPVQIHSNEYHNPEQLPEGAVLVVGAGSSGAQIADELCQAGRKVYLSVGPHGRPPRSYRGRDFCWWHGVLGVWDDETPPPGGGQVTLAISGANGGHTVDFRALAATGIELVGMTESYAEGTVHFAQDLRANIDEGDAAYLSLLDEADAYVERNGLTFPEDPEARLLGPDPTCITRPRLELSLLQADISSIVWATGYKMDFSWLQVDAFDEDGRPKHRRGVVATEPGVYFLGLPWLSRRVSPTIWGVWHDAMHIANHIITQRNYLALQ